MGSDIKAQRETTLETTLQKSSYLLIRNGLLRGNAVNGDGSDEPVAGATSAGNVAAATAASTAGGTVFVVRRWWNDCFIHNKLRWRERAAKGLSVC